MSDNPILSIRDLSFSRGDGFQLQVEHLDFLPGRVYGLVGPNGAGKSSLLQVLGLLEAPDSGQVLLQGRPVVPGGLDELTARQQMTVVMENPLLFRGTVQRNLTSGLRFHGVPRSEWAQRTREALDIVGLPEFAHRKANQISRGEMQRIAIARALILHPEVLFLDEPFAHVDRAYVRILEALIGSINKQSGTTIMFTTHDLLQAYRLADEVISLVDGKLVNGSLENLFSGEIVTEGEAQWVTVSPTIRISVATSLSGSVHLAIPPQDIILSRRPFESSARNTFQGEIRQIQLDENAVRVAVDVTDGIRFTALVTKTSLGSMALSVGLSVFLTFKSTAVTVF